MAHRYIQADYTQIYNRKAAIACQSRKSTRVTNNNNNNTGSALVSSIPVCADSETPRTVPGP